MPDVTIIPATRPLHTALRRGGVSRRRVAGYARVSTDTDEQFTSYEAQIDYYTNYIKRNPNWDFVRVYTDEGISGTDTRHRTGFNEMVTDALDGKIDLIVTKSVSRFARNTVDSLTTIRKLKEHGVEVFFEKEAIWTFDGKGELLLTIMSSLAQEESRSISENVTWGRRKQFADGKISLPYSHFLGYRRGADDLPEIVPEEAEIVRRIYSEYMAGGTYYTIAAGLTADAVPTPGGKHLWRATTVASILQNEKYRGSATLQKSFTVDFLTKTRKKNEGEIPRYYVENSHSAIIAPGEWEAVQSEIRRRKDIGRQYSAQSCFSTRLICGDCGGFYGSKVWHSNSKYRKIVMQCNCKFKGDSVCATPSLEENELKSRFLAVWNGLFMKKDGIVEDCGTVQKMLCGTDEIDKEINELNDELEVTAGLIRRCIEDNSVQPQDQNAYEERYEGFVDRCKIIQARIKALREKKEERLSKAEEIGGFIFKLSESDGEVAVFDDRLFLTVIDSVTAQRDGRLVFRFKNGVEVEG